MSKHTDKKNPKEIELSVSTQTFHVTQSGRKAYKINDMIETGNSFYQDSDVQFLSKKVKEVTQEDTLEDMMEVRFEYEYVIIDKGDNEVKNRETFRYHPGLMLERDGNLIVYIREVPSHDTYAFGHAVKHRIKNTNILITEKSNYNKIKVMSIP